MKKLLCAILAIASVNAFAFNGTIGRSASLSFDGTVVPESIEKESVNVRNSHSTTLLAGQVVVLDTVDDDGASVEALTTSGLSPYCIMEESCAVGALCACQNKGKFDLALFDSTAGAAVAGKRFYMSTNNAGYISARGTESASEVPGGIFYDAASASGTVQVYLFR